MWPHQHGIGPTDTTRQSVLLIKNGAFVQIGDKPYNVHHLKKLHISNWRIKSQQNVLRSIHFPAAVFPYSASQSAVQVVMEGETQLIKM